MLERLLTISPTADNPDIRKEALQETETAVLMMSLFTFPSTDVDLNLLAHLERHKRMMRQWYDRIQFASARARGLRIGCNCCRCTTDNDKFPRWVEQHLLPKVENARLRIKCDAERDGGSVDLMKDFLDLMDLYNRELVETERTSDGPGPRQQGKPGRYH